MKAGIDQRSAGGRLNERLATGGFRFTLQREHVYHVLLQRMDHPTAEEVFIRAKKGKPEISMATVYNCLDALVKCGLVRLVSLDRGASRYCANMKEHGHFYCDTCGEVFDIGLNGRASAPSFHLPKGYKVNHYEVAVHGVCSACAAPADT
jgi:Fur family transcriptional regulator, peroxide stress response regulator